MQELVELDGWLQQACCTATLAGIQCEDVDASQPCFPRGPLLLVLLWPLWLLLAWQ